MLGVLAVPALAGATTGPSGDVGSGDGAGSEGDAGSGTAGGTGMEPASTGEPATSGATSGDGETDTEHSDDHEAGSKGCSIGPTGTAPGMLALALLGLHGLRRRRA